MITRELDIVFNILNTVRAAELNSDEVISERLVRSYIHKYRLSLLKIHFRDGMLVADEVYQEIKLNLSQFNTNELISDLPKIYDKKLKIDILDYPVSIVDNEDYKLYRKNRFTRYHPKATIKNNKLYVYKGFNSECCVERNTDLWNAINLLNGSNFDSIESSAFLVNPDDAKSYDWKKDIFPFPGELVDKLTQVILAKEFNIVLSTNADKIGDSNSEVSNTQKQ